jgi:hypothetical protein
MQRAMEHVYRVCGLSRYVTYCRKQRVKAEFSLLGLCQQTLGCFWVGAVWRGRQVKKQVGNERASADTTSREWLYGNLMTNSLQA